MFFDIFGILGNFIINEEVINLWKFVRKEKSIYIFSLGGKKLLDLVVNVVWMKYIWVGRERKERESGVGIKGEREVFRVWKKEF